MREAGVDTLPRLRSAAFLMRAIMSPMGSFTIWPSPARLDHAGDLPGVRQLSERDAAHLELAVIGPRTPGEGAAVADAHLRGVARQFRQLQARGEALLQRQVLVVGDLLQRLALGRVLLDHALDHFVAVD